MAKQFNIDACKRLIEEGYYWSVLVEDSTIELAGDQESGFMVYPFENKMVAMSFAHGNNSEVSETNDLMELAEGVSGLSAHVMITL